MLKTRTNLSYRAEVGEIRTSPSAAKDAEGASPSLGEGRGSLGREPYRTGIGSLPLTRGQVSGRRIVSQRPHLDERSGRCENNPLVAQCRYLRAYAALGPRLRGTSPVLAVDTFFLAVALAHWPGRGLATTCGAGVAGDLGQPSS